MRARLEPLLDTDLSDVRVHTSPAARDAAARIHARAFTHRSHIWVGAGQREDDLGLMAHEATHVVQQTGPHAGRDIVARQPEGAEVVSTSAGNEPHGPMLRVLGVTTAEQWFEQHSQQLKVEVIRLLGASALALPAGVSWSGQGLAGFCSALVNALDTGVGAFWVNLSRVLLPDSLRQAIDDGRDTGTPNIGSPEWQPGVPPEIARRLLLRLVDSLPRAVPIYVRTLELQGGEQGGAAPAAPVPTLVLAPSPLPASDRPTAALASSHPIDAFAVLALTGNAHVDLEAYRRLQGVAPAAPVAGTLRPVQFEFQAQQGAPYWLRVITPHDATREEVAYELYGDSSMAYRLLDAAPLFGFPRSDVNAVERMYRFHEGGFFSQGQYEFLPHHEAAFANAMRARSSQPLPEVLEDPAAQLVASPLAEEAALHSARGIRPTAGVSRETVLQRFVFVINRLAGIEEMAPPLVRPPGSPAFTFTIDIPSGTTSTEPWVAPESQNLAIRIRATRERTQARLERLAEDHPDTVAMWDEQTLGQLEIVNAVHGGIEMAVAMAEQFRAWPRVFDAVRDVANAYIAAAEASELYEVGRARLNAAEAKSRLFSVTLMELLLGELRTVIDEVRSSEITTHDRDNAALYDTAGLESREQRLRERLAAVRPLLLQNPEAAAAEVNDIYRELLEFQAGVTIAGNLDAIDAVWQTLFDNISAVGALISMFSDRGNDAIVDGLDATLAMRDEWFAVYHLWREDPEAGARLLKQKAQSQEWRRYFERMRQLIQDEQTLNAYVTFGLMVGIAVLTAGIGAYVEAFAGAAWGATAGFVAGTATEAVLFTSMTYMLVDRDPSVGGFFAALGENLIVFGALKALAHGYTALVGLEAAGTIAGRAGGFLVAYAGLNGWALFQANQDQVARTGQPLTREQIVTISLHTLAFMGAAAVGSRLLGVRALQTRGELDGSAYRVARARSALERTVHEIETSKGERGDLTTLIEQQRAFLEAQRSQLEAIQRVVARADEMTPARRDAELRRFGIDPEVALSIRTGESFAMLEANIDALEGARIFQALESVGGSDYMISADLYAAARRQFVRQGATVYDVEGNQLLLPLQRGMQLPVAQMPGERSFVVRPADGPSFRVIERTPGMQGRIAGPVEPRPSAPTGESQQVRLRRIAEALNRQREQIHEMLSADRNSRREERGNVLAEVRDPGHTPGGRPDFEAFVLDTVMGENRAAVARMRANLHEMNPDVIVGMERGGAFLARVLAYNDPVLADKVRIIRTHTNPRGRHMALEGQKYDAAAMQAEYQALIDAGARHIVVVDSYFGGHTARSLVGQVFIPLAERNANVRIETYWIRETFGFEHLRRGGGVDVSEINLNLNREMRERYERVADRISVNRMEQVKLLLGDDMNIVFTPGAREPIRVFNAQGEVIQVYQPRPGQTTADVLIELMNGGSPPVLTPGTPVRGTYIPGVPPPIREEDRPRDPDSAGRR